jgi:subtilase family serine protease
MASAQDERTPEQPAAQAAAYQAPPAAAVRQQGSVIIPESSVARPEDAGKFAHTFLKIFAPAGRPMASITPDNTFAEYPASIACVYKVGPNYTGCVPANNGKHASGGWGAIALVDAYDDPTAQADLDYFDTFFGVPKAKFEKVYANSSFGTLNGLTASCAGVPPVNSGWGLESALDVEWAHAMAPSAKIILVEACSNSYNDLLYAEEVAGIKVSAAGGGDISNSWGSGEWATEAADADNFFYRYYWQKITYFASAGDSGWGAAYPSSSPWVISAGGTTINRDASGNFLNESCWAGSGGGVSAYELWQNPPNILNGMGPWSGFQYEVAGQTARQTPDISFDADPASGVWVRFNGSWYVVGGTSVSSPALAGIVNSAKQKLGQAPPGGGFYYTGENNLLYSQLNAFTAYPKNFYDVTTGANGVGHNAGAGYDQCTGIGSPRGKLGK